MPKKRRADRPLTRKIKHEYPILRSSKLVKELLSIACNT